MISKLALAQLVVTLVAGAISTSALAGSDDQVVVVGGEPSGPVLIVLMERLCNVDYAKELGEAGLVGLRVQRYLQLRDLARSAGLPKGFVPQHLLMTGGYVFADHVDPAKVMEVLRLKPDISGLIGSERCPDAVEHQAIHNETPRIFDSRKSN